MVKANRSAGSSELDDFNEFFSRLNRDHELVSRAESVGRAILDSGDEGALKAEVAIKQALKHEVFRGLTSARKHYKQDLGSLAKSVAESGRVRRLDGTPITDYNEVLGSIKARGFFDELGELDKMMLFDGMVSGFDFLVESQMKDIVLVLEMPENPTRKEKKAAKLITALTGIGKAEDGLQARALIDGGLRQFLVHAVKHIVYGFSIINYAWDVREIGGERFLMPVKNRYVVPSSLNRIVYVDDRIAGFEQVSQEAPDEFAMGGLATNRGHDTREKFTFIPIDDCLFFRHRYVDGSELGTSHYRTAYPWSRAKIEAFKDDARMVQRVIGGIAIMKEMGHSGDVNKQVSSADFVKAVRILNAYAEGKTSFLYMPFGIDVQLQFPARDNQFQENRFDFIDKQIRIALGGMLASDSNSGAYADQVDIIVKNLLLGAANTIWDVIFGLPGTPGSGMIERMIEINIGIDSSFRMPAIRPIWVGISDPEKLVRTLSRASQFLQYLPGAGDEMLFRKQTNLLRVSRDELEKRREEIAKKSGQVSQEGTQAPQNAQRSPDAIKAEVVETSNNDKEDGIQEK